MNKSSRLSRIVFIITLLIVGGIGLSSCTKTNGCEFVGGDYFLTGTFHYFKNPVQIPQWTNSTAEILDVNAYLVKDELGGTLYDTVLITKSSVPNEFRVEGEKHVAVSVVSTVSGATTTEARHDFYKLLCIEEIDK